MKKRIIIPVYKDRDKTLGWERRYQKDENYEVIVYEKVDNPLSSEIQTLEGFKVSGDNSEARSSWIFLYHICKFYNNLADVEIFTKTHPHLQKIYMHESISESHKYQYLGFWNKLRTFFWAHDNEYELLLKSFKGDSNWHDGGWATISRAPIEDLLQNGIREKINNFTNFCFDSHEKILSKPEFDLKKRNSVVKMKLIFPDYKVPSFCVLRSENVWSVKRELILKHPITLYQDILKKINSNEDGWGTMCHDEWGIFWPLFWNETLKRY